MSPTLLEVSLSLSSSPSRTRRAVLTSDALCTVWYWLGQRFATPLLIQSLLLIMSQFALLFVCLRYDPTLSAFRVSDDGVGEHQHLRAQSAAAEDIRDEEEEALMRPSSAQKHALNDADPAEATSDGREKMGAGRPGNLWAWRSFGVSTIPSPSSA